MVDLILLKCHLSSFRVLNADMAEIIVEITLVSSLCLECFALMRTSAGGLCSPDERRASPVLGAIVIIHRRV